MKKILFIVLGGIALIAIIASLSSRGGSTPAANTEAAAPTSNYLAAPASPAEPMHSAADGTVGDGVYQVGTDVPAGRYKTAGPEAGSVMPMCYWARSKDDSGQITSVIANDNIQGPGSVTVKAGEFFTLSGGCTWTKQ